MGREVEIVYVLSWSQTEYRCAVIVFFFSSRRRHTRFDCDWSSDVCSSDLWPESSGARAQHALDQTVYAIRHALGSDVIVATGRELRLNPDLVRVDVWEFEQAIRASQWSVAVGRYKGPLLDGFHFADSHELESWIETNRSRLRLEDQKAIEFLANSSAEAGDHSPSGTL